MKYGLPHPHSTRCVCLCPPLTPPAAPALPHQLASLALYDRLMADLAGGRRHDLEHPEQIIGVFPAKVVASTTYYRGPLTLGQDASGKEVEIKVRAAGTCRWQAV
jgi:hypothetical protein